MRSHISNHISPLKELKDTTIADIIKLSQENNQDTIDDETGKMLPREALNPFVDDDNDNWMMSPRKSLSMMIIVILVLANHRRCQFDTWSKWLTSRQSWHIVDKEATSPKSLTKTTMTEYTQRNFKKP